MKTNSRFTRVAVASGLVVACGAAVLGITGFASAELAGRSDSSAVVAVDGTATGEGTTDDQGLGALQAEGTVSAESTGPVTGTIGETPGRPQFMAAAAEVLGMTESDLIKELLSGKSIKQVAEAKNVDLDRVVTALTAALKTHLDAEVASGEHTQAEVDAKITEFKTRLDDIVNGVRPAGGPGMGGRGGHGHGHGGRGHHGDMGGMPGDQGTGTAEGAGFSA